MTLSITRSLLPLWNGKALIAAGITPPIFVPPQEGYRDWAKVIHDTLPASWYMVQDLNNPERAVEAASTLKNVSGHRVLVHLSADGLCDVDTVDGVYLTHGCRTAATIENALRSVRAKNPDAALVCNIEMPSKHLSRSAAVERFMGLLHSGCTMGVISPWIDWNESNLFLEQCKRVCNPLPPIVQAIYPEVTQDQWELVRSTGVVSKTIHNQLGGCNIEETSSALAKSRLKEAMALDGAWIDLSTVDDIERAFLQLQLKQ